MDLAMALGWEYEQRSKDYDNTVNGESSIR